MRYSKQRDEILKIVYSTNEHPTADLIYSEARKRIPSISLGTVYRNLNQLVEMGSVKTVPDGPTLRYDRNVIHHDHLKCTVCGKLYDVQILSAELSNEIQTKYNFKVSDMQLTMEGVCHKHEPVNKGD